MQNTYVAYAFVGIKAAVAFLILKTGIELVNKLGKNIIAKICFLIVFILLIVLELTSKSFSSIYLILIGGVIGIICYSILNLDNKGENK